MPDPTWLPAGPLGDLIADDTADGLIRLARSTDPAETDQLMRIGMTRGLRHARFAIDAIAVERELSRAKEARRLELTLIAVTGLTLLASIAQAIAAFVR
ncbi:hypothetical protein [Phytohabitans houttuyneae]|nr:hypothetical protein [Phytohabitans houttuyneae]